MIATYLYSYGGVALEGFLSSAFWHSLDGVLRHRASDRSGWGKKHRGFETSVNKELASMRSAR